MTNEQLQRLNDERAAAQRTARESARFQLAAIEAERVGKADLARHYDNANRRLLGRPEIIPAPPPDPAADEQRVRVAVARQALEVGVAAGLATGRVMGRRGY